MFEALVVLLATAVPWALGYGTASYRSALVPTAALVIAAVNIVVSPARDGHHDEVDVWPAVLVALSAIALMICWLAPQHGAVC